MSRHHINSLSVDHKSVDDSVNTVDALGDFANIRRSVVDLDHSHQADAVGKAMDRQLLKPQSSRLFEFVQNLALDRMRDGGVVLFALSPGGVMQRGNGIIHGRQLPVVA
jgi:hypothetical protein